jgi:hypothetical protein
MTEAREPNSSSSEAAPLLGDRTFTTTERHYQQAQAFDAHRAYIDALFSKATNILEIHVDAFWAGRGLRAMSRPLENGNGNFSPAR